MPAVSLNFYELPDEVVSHLLEYYGSITDILQIRNVCSEFLRFVAYRWKPAHLAITPQYLRMSTSRIGGGVLSCVPRFHEEEREAPEGDEDAAERECTEAIGPVPLVVERFGVRVIIRSCLKNDPPVTSPAPGSWLWWTEEFEGRASPAQQLPATTPRRRKVSPPRPAGHPCALLQNLADICFVYLTPQLHPALLPSRQLPPPLLRGWLDRVSRTLTSISYTQKKQDFVHLTVFKYKKRHLNSPRVLQDSPATPPPLTLTGPGFRSILASGTPHVSLLDIMNLALRNQSSLQSIKVESNAHFPSIADLPKVPPCPRFFFDCNSNSKNCSSASACSQVNQELPIKTPHVECWQTLVAKVLGPNASFRSLNSLTLSGSYLPGFLTLLAFLDVRLEQLNHLTLRGSLAVGRRSFEIFRRKSSAEDFEPGGSSEAWLTCDLVRVLLFGENILKPRTCVFESSGGEDVGNEEQEESLRLNFWVAIWLSFWRSCRFPKLKRLTLHCGCGLLERRLWWGILLGDLFRHSSSLEVLELDCTVESLCHRSHVVLDILLSAASNGSSIFQSLKKLCLIQATSFLDISSLESLLKEMLGREIIVQIKRLHLYVLSPQFVQQASIYFSRLSSPELFPNDLWPSDAPASMTLDFSSTYVGITVDHHQALTATADELRVANNNSSSSDFRDGSSSDRQNHHLIRIPSIKVLNIVRFLPHYARHRALLSCLRFPKSVFQDFDETSLETVFVKLNTTDGVGRTFIPTSALHARTMIEDTIMMHPDIGRARDIRVIPSPSLSSLSSNSTKQLPLFEENSKSGEGGGGGGLLHWLQIRRNSDNEVLRS